MKIRISAYGIFLNLLLISVSVTAQSNSEIIKELYDGAYGIVEQVEDLTTLSVQSVWLASTITGVATFTGTLTQNTSNPDYWTYAASPNDKLTLHFSNGSEIHFTFTSFDGYTDGTADDFLDSHTMDFKAEITGEINLRIQSQTGPNNGVIEYTRIITGTSVYEYAPITVNLTNSGDRKVTVSGGFAFGDYHAQTSGTISSGAINYNISESYSTYIGHNSNIGLYSQERHIRSNSSASGSFGSFKFRNLYCYYIGGTAFIDSANAGIFNQAIETNSWTTEGELLKDDQYFGSIQFNTPPVENSYGSLLIAKCVDGNDYFLDNLLMWYVTEVKSKSTAPDNFSLSQNYPNPFNPATTIKYSIPAVIATPPNSGGSNLSNSSQHQQIASSHTPRNDALVQLIIYDILGREIATLVNENKSPGNYEVQFNASNLSSGVYIYRIKAGNFIKTRKMLLIK